MNQGVEKGYAFRTPGKHIPYVEQVPAAHSKGKDLQNSVNMIVSFNGVGFKKYYKGRNGANYPYKEIYICRQKKHISYLNRPHVIF